MPVDKFPGSEAIDSPADEFYAVTPSDTVDLPNGVPKFIFIGGAGTVMVVGKDQDAGTDGVALVSGANQYHPIRPSRILSTGTDATDILAFY